MTQLQASQRRDATLRLWWAHKTIPRRACMTARATIYADYAADLRAMSIKRFKAFHPLHDTAAAAKVFTLLASGKPVLLHEDEWALVAAELTKHGIFRTTTIDVVARLPIRVAVVAHPSGALHRARVAEHTVLDDLFALNDAATSAFPVLRTFPEVCAGSSAARAAAFVHYSLPLLLHDASSPSVPTMCCLVRIGSPPPIRHSQPPST